MRISIVHTTQSLFNPPDKNRRIHTPKDIQDHFENYDVLEVAAGTPYVIGLKNSVFKWDVHNPSQPGKIAALSLHTSLTLAKKSFKKLDSSDVIILTTYNDGFALLCEKQPLKIQARSN